jgi:hypothetical protein
LILFQSFDCFSQKQEQKRDSIEITQIATDFFSWYILESSNNSNGECYPIFIQDKNGMTTLDYSKYFKNLIEHSFSDTLVAKEKLSYQVCIDNLAKVKYSDFLKFDGLDDFESRNCDFTNYYRWTGGQEMFDGYTVISVKIDGKKSSVIGYLFDNNYESGGIKINKRAISVTFIKQNNKWKILDISR